MNMFSEYTRTANELTELIDKLKSEIVPSVEDYKLALSCIDLTTLNGNDTHAKVEALCNQAIDLNQPDKGLPGVAAVCVYPPFVSTAKRLLEGTDIQVAAVAGAFPSGQSPLFVKLAEVAYTAEEGADEIDMVLSRGTFLEQRYAEVRGEVESIRIACGDAHLKVILETGELGTIENIRKASELSIQGGAHFIKTSTGKINPAATPEAMWIMCETILDYYQTTGRKIGIKPAGGIVTPDDALLYLNIVREILGEEWLTPELFRIGASRLANNLAEKILGE